MTSAPTMRPAATRRARRSPRWAAGVGIVLAMAMLATTAPAGAAGLDLTKTFGQRFVGSASAPQSLTVPLTTPAGAIRNAVLAEIDRTSFPSIEDPIFGTTLISGSRVRDVVRAAYLGLDSSDAFSYRVDGFSHPLPDDFLIGGDCVGADGARTTLCTMTITFRPTAAGPRVDPMKMEITITGGLNALGNRIDGVLGDWGLGDLVVRLLSPLLDPIVEGVIARAIEGSLLDPVVTASGTGVAGPFTDPAVFVRRQYADLGAPAPTAATVDGWLHRFAQGQSPALVIDELRRSPAWEATIGPVARLYTAYYLRTPETAGLRYWLGRRADGVGLHRLSQTFSQVPEFRQRYGTLTDAGFVDLVYRNVLGRAPEPAGLAWWTAELAGGMTRGRLMLGFSESPEYRTRMAPTVTAVGLWYGMLGRTPSTPEVTSAADRLRSGVPPTTLALEILASAEYRAVVLG